MKTKFKWNDGGRHKYFTGTGGDCVARAVAIAAGKDYKEVYDVLAAGNAKQRKTKRAGRHTGKKTALHGINVKRKWFKDQMKDWGFQWVSTMKIGQGCKVHLRADELPKGRLVVRVTKHLTAMIDGVINDTYDPSRNGERCVYGYWIFKG